MKVKKTYNVEQLTDKHLEELKLLLNRPSKSNVLDVLINEAYWIEKAKGKQ
jgi:hypothetical protein